MDFTVSTDAPCPGSSGERIRRCHLASKGIQKWPGWESHHRGLRENPPECLFMMSLLYLNSLLHSTAEKTESLRDEETRLPSQQQVAAVAPSPRFPCSSHGQALLSDLSQRRAGGEGQRAWILGPTGVGVGGEAGFRFKLLVLQECSVTPRVPEHQQS